jgi:hypothetical protein
MAKEDMLDGADRVAVDLDRVVDIGSVTTAHRRDDRYLMTHRKFKHRRIAKL